jgi:DNA-binding MarR family transcriptional regulator
MHTYSVYMRERTGLDACSCFATRQAARHITRLYERHLADIDLTAAQFSILFVLDEKPRASMSLLSDALVMDRTTLQRAVKPLERDGLIAAKRGGGDGDPRQMAFLLTPAGRDKLKKAMVRWTAAQSEFEAQVGTTRAARLRKDLLSLEVGASS